MNLSDFDFPLPEDRIAQKPTAERSGSRLFFLNRKAGQWTHGHFPDLLQHLGERPLIVLNDTQVLPAKLPGRHRETGKPMELLLVQEETPATWTAMVKGLARLKPGTEIVFGEADPFPLTAVFLGVKEELGMFRLESSRGDIARTLQELGHPPLPPYIKREGKEMLSLDRERYQTVFAEHPGAIAAPTAGLHFTREILDQIRLQTDLVTVTLHVGVGTFQPVRVETVEEHRMHKEYFRVSSSALDQLVRAKKERRRILAVGTTCVRVLESLDLEGDVPGPQSGWTDHFIYPGYRFRNVDRLLTNFHLPRSTLFMLVSAFAGLPLIQDAYQEAIQQGYRFFSYGDAMLIE